MTSYCAGKSKATALINWSDGSKVNVESSSPPLTIEAAEVWNYSITFLYEEINPENYKGDITKNLGILASPVSLGAISYSGTAVSGYGGSIKSDIDVTSADGTSVFRLINNSINGHTVSNLRLTRLDMQTRVTVSDLNGRIHQETHPKTANWKVSCDDDCPPGFHKCTHKQYPGYCCVSCKDVGERLKNIASKVGK